MSRDFSIKNALHRDPALSVVLDKQSGLYYFAVVSIRPTTPAIVSVATTDANWTALATGLTNILQWRISELGGNDFYYAYVVAPGDNFSVAYGWVSEATSPSAIYFKRPASANVTCKLETWSA